MGVEVVIQSSKERRMRTSVTALALLVGSCGPSDSFPVADFALECSSLDEPTLRNSLDAFAKQEGLSTDLQVSSAEYLRLRMDGEGFGHQTYVEFWAVETEDTWTTCREAKIPCVDVTVYTGGRIPEDEGTSNTVTQRRVAERLKRLLNGFCTSERVDPNI